MLRYLALVVASLLVAAPAAAKPTLVVAPLQSDPEDARDARSLSRFLRTTVGQTNSYTLVTPEDMGAIDEELKRQLSGGCAETSCIADIGGALGAQYMITGSLDRLGRRYILNLKLIDIEQVKAIKTLAIQAGSTEAFADKLPQQISQFLEADEAGGKKQAGNPATAAAKPAILETCKAPCTSLPLTVAEVQRVVLRHHAQIKYCFELEMLRTPDVAEGTVVVSWQVGLDGGVTRTHTVEHESTIENSALNGCITRKVRTWVFPTKSNRSKVKWAFSRTYKSSQLYPAFMVIVAGSKNLRDALNQLYQYKQSNAPEFDGYPQLYLSDYIVGLNPGYYIVVVAAPDEKRVAQALVERFRTNYPKLYGGAYFRPVKIENPQKLTVRQLFPSSSRRQRQDRRFWNGRPLRCPSGTKVVGSPNGQFFGCHDKHGEPNGPYAERWYTGYKMYEGIYDGDFRSPVEMKCWNMQGYEIKCDFFRD